MYECRKLCKTHILTTSSTWYWWGAFSAFQHFIWSNSFRHTYISISISISHLKVLQLNRKPRRLIRVEKNLFVNSKVRSVIKCQECCKPRCVYYALKKLTSAESALVEETGSSELYICGSPLFPPSFDSTVVHRTCFVQTQWKFSTTVQLEYHFLLTFILLWSSRRNTRRW